MFIFYSLRHANTVRFVKLALNEKSRYFADDTFEANFSLQDTYYIFIQISLIRRY